MVLKRALLLLIGVVLMAGIFLPVEGAAAQAGVYYASPDGSRNGDGSMANPWDLQTALKAPIPAGSTLYLRGGRYGSGGYTTFTAKLYGTTDAPIVVRSAPGEWATVDGSIASHAENTWWWGFEITNSSPERHTSPSNRPGGINIKGYDNRVINMVINNVGQPGVGFWKEAVGGQVYGTIIYGVGLYDATTKADNSNWTRGSAIYAQNRDGDRYITDNITFRNFTTGMKAYTEEGYANGFKFHYNVLFDNRDRNIFASGSKNPFRGLEMVGNMTYRAPGDNERSLSVGFSSNDQYDAVIDSNYLVNGSDDLGGLFVKQVRSLRVTNNTIVSNNHLVNFQQANAPEGQTWDGNAYYGAASGMFLANNQVMGFIEWKAKTGFDANSTHAVGTPSENRVFVRPNQYEAKRGNVVVYNWQGLESVAADLSSFLQPGDHYRVMDAQNFLGAPVLEGVYDGSPVNLPMNLSAVAPIVGNVSHFQNVHTPNQFNTFVVIGW